MWHKETVLKYKCPFFLKNFLRFFTFEKEQTIEPFKKKKNTKKKKKFKIMSLLFDDEVFIIFNYYHVKCV
jgi:hypothetical protein